MKPSVFHNKSFSKLFYLSESVLHFLSEQQQLPLIFLTEFFKLFFIPKESSLKQPHKHENTDNRSFRRSAVCRPSVGSGVKHEEILSEVSVIKDKNSRRVRFTFSLDRKHFSRNMFLNVDVRETSDVSVSLNAPTRRVLF